MDLETHFRSVTSELRALQDRVRHFIAEKHWVTDGEWKESVLKSFLRRNLPETVKVGRGFVVHPEFTSTQIDLLIYDATKPVLFRDGDLVFVTPGAVRAIIEVKTRVTMGSLRRALSKLAVLSAGLRQVCFTKKFIGLFVYDSVRGSDKAVLEALRDSAGHDTSRTVDIVSIGQSRFFRWWQNPPNSRAVYQRWHSYYVEDKAPAYFLHNVIEAACGDAVKLNPALWFPPESKEASKTGDIGHQARIRFAAGEPDVQAEAHP